jgi:hypothetical protein
MLIDMTPLEDMFVDVFQYDPLKFGLIPAPIRPFFMGAELGFTVGEALVDYTLAEGVVGGLDLFTPEIRRFEETALVGLGGMII